MTHAAVADACELPTANLADATNHETDMLNRAMPEMIYVAHELVDQLLMTEVTVYEVETALKMYCVGWNEVDRSAVLRLAVEFADIKDNALCMAQEVTHAETMAEMEHH